MSTLEDGTRRERNRSIMIELLRRLGTQDYAGACALMTEQVVCDWPYPPMPDLPPEIRGRDAMERFFAGGMSAFEPYRYEITAIFDLVDPDRLIAEYRSNSTFKPSGAPYRNQYLGIFQFEDGLVSYWREYINPDTVARVLATAERPTKPSHDGRTSKRPTRRSSSRPSASARPGPT